MITSQLYTCLMLLKFIFALLKVVDILQQVFVFFYYTNEMYTSFRKQFFIKLFHCCHFSAVIHRILERGSSRFTDRRRWLVYCISAPEAAWFDMFWFIEKIRGLLTDAWLPLLITSIIAPRCVLFVHNNTAILKQKDKFNRIIQKLLSSKYSHIDISLDLPKDLLWPTTV